MKKIFGQCVLIIAILFAMGQSAWALTLQTLQTTLQQHQQVQGQFEQYRYLKALKKPIQVSGQFLLIQNRGLLWSVQTPFVDMIRVTGSGIEQRTAQGDWVRLGDASLQKKQTGLFLDLLAGRTEALSKQFHLYLEGDLKQWKLTLKPSTLLMKQIFESIELTGDHLVKQVVLYEKQGDRIDIQFSHIVSGVILDESQAKLLP